MILYGLIWFSDVSITISYLSPLCDTRESKIKLGFLEIFWFFNIFIKQCIKIIIIIIIVVSPSGKVLNFGYFFLCFFFCFDKSFKGWHDPLKMTFSSPFKKCKNKVFYILLDFSLCYYHISKLSVPPPMIWRTLPENIMDLSGERVANIYIVPLNRVYSSSSAELFSPRKELSFCQKLKSLHLGNLLMQAFDISNLDYSI